MNLITICATNRKLCNDNDCVYCFNKSFASSKRVNSWSDKNELKPRHVSKSSDKMIIFNCHECKHEFTIKLSKITNGKQWCQYCGHKKLCDNEKCTTCFNFSFASIKKSKFISDKTINPRTLFKTSHKKYNFNCNNCNHTFDSNLYNITIGNNWCPFCSKTNGKLCDNECVRCFEKSFASNEKSQYWSDKNKLTARQVMKCSDKKYIFDCNFCNNEYKSNLNNIINNRWCPCKKNKTETKLYNWLSNNYNHKIITQHYININNKKYFYDFYIPDLNLIIELDGRQHFEQVKCWNSVDVTLKRDIIKMKYLKDNYINLIRVLQIDVWFGYNNWEKNLKNYIKVYDEHIIIYLDNKHNLYKKHKDCML